MRNCSDYVTKRQSFSSAVGTFILACTVLGAIDAKTQAQTIGTVAGGGYPGSVATAYGAPGASSVAVDASGNLYVAVTGANQVWVVSPTGAVTEIIGNGPGAFKVIGQINVTPPVTYSGDGGPATLATLNTPNAVALDPNGNLYIADTGNNVIRKVTAATGIITTVAGSGVKGYSGDLGPATKAQLNQPYGVAADSMGNLYIADTSNNVIREVAAETGMISTVAGNNALPMYSYSGDGGPATAAGLNFPSGVAVDSNGNLYIADNYNRVIRKVTAATGIISTFAGNGAAVFSGSGGLATETGISFPQSVALDIFGNLYITAGNRVLEVTAATGIVNNIAGTSGFGYSGDGGPASQAVLSAPSGIALDSSGNVYIADTGNNVVRRITASNGLIGTMVGNGTAGYSGDGGQATTAQLDEPFGVAADATGNLYISDTYNSVIRKVVASSGVISTLAGTYNPMSAGFGQGDNGPATSATLLQPSGLALDSSGNLYLAETLASRIRKVSAATGVISTIAGGFIATPGGFPEGYTGDGGSATMAQLNEPRGVAVDSSGNVYIADTQNSAIRRVDTSGIITTVINTQLNKPTSVAVDSAGNLYIADQGDNVIRRLPPGGNTLSTVAGTGTAGYAGDNGPAAGAQLNQPASVALASNGDLYFADTGNNVIRKVTATTGVISTVAGTGAYAFGGDQGPATGAQLASPGGVAVGPTGQFYIADTYNNRVRAVPGPVVAPLPTVSQSFAKGSSVTAGGTTTLSFLMTNPATDQAASAVGFRSALSSGLAVASPNGLSGSCGDITAQEGSQTVAVSGANLPAGGTCTFSIDVSAAGLGAQYSTVGDLVSSGQAANWFSLADITIDGTAAVTSGASFAAGPVTPNALLAYFGPVACAPNEQMLINGSAVTILFGNSSQVNFVSPESIPGSSVVVQVACNGSAVVTLTIPAAAVNPALFTQTGTGTGAGSIVNADGTVNSAASPAPQGSYISVYGTGFGSLNAAGSDGLRHLAANVTATIGGADAPVIYAGEAPGETIGLQQINIQVPTGLTSGTNAPIVLAANGRSTQGGVTVEIQ